MHVGEREIGYVVGKKIFLVALAELMLCEIYLRMFSIVLFKPLMKNENERWHKSSKLIAITTFNRKAKLKLYLLALLLPHQFLMVLRPANKNTFRTYFCFVIPQHSYLTSGKEVGWNKS